MEKYRLLGDYNYLHRPYPGQMSYEFLHEWPYAFKDLQNYTLALHEKYGADLWTCPEAMHKGEHVWIQSGSFYDDLKVCLENTSNVPDTFILSAAWDENRLPTGDRAGLDSRTAYLDGGETQCVGAWIDSGDFSGYHVLWIKAVSKNAFQGSDPYGTYYVEVPFVINIDYTEPAGKPQKTVAGNGFPGLGGM